MLASGQEGSGDDDGDDIQRKAPPLFEDSKFAEHALWLSGVW